MAVAITLGGHGSGRRPYLVATAACATAAAALALLACPPDQGRCKTAADCRQGEVCIEELCRAVCNSSYDCRGGERCEDGICVAAADRPDAAVQDAAPDDHIPAGDSAQATDRASSDSSAPEDSGAAEATVDAGDPCEPVDCSAHERCTVVGNLGLCTCVTGYHDLGAGCVWTGGPQDPGFATADTWTAEGNALVDTAADGADDPGVGALPAEAVCEGGALVQSFDMPELGDAELLVLTFQHSKDIDMGFCEYEVELRVSLNGAAYDFMSWSSWQEARICLGARMYGGPVELRIAASDTCSFCPSTSGVPAFYVDSVAVVPAAPGECAEPGTVPNGDFEAGVTGWSASASETAAAAVVDGVGSNGSAGGYLEVAQGCDAAVLLGRASTPLGSSTPQPALSLWSDGTGTFPLMVRLGDFTLTELPPASAPRELRLCLVRGLHGLAHPLWLILSAEDEQGRCEVSTPGRFYVDDLAFVSEQRCPADALLVDGGFENMLTAPALAPAWLLDGGEGGSAQILPDPEEVRSGMAALRLHVDAVCAAALARTTFTVPEPQGDGPALTLWYRAVNVTDSNLVVVAGDQFSTLPAAATYTQHTVCLPVADAGTAQPLGIWLSGPQSGLCGDPALAREAWFDDIELTTSLACQ